MRAALDALLRAPAPARTDASAALAALAHGALTGARGNSGVIISQMLRGAADALTDAADAGRVVTAACCPPRWRAAPSGPGGRVAEPVPGTMISVLEARRGGRGGRGSAELGDVVAAAAAGAAAALDGDASAAGRAGRGRGRRRGWARGRRACSTRSRP